MSWAYIIRASDRKIFKRCRRAWDLGSRSRQNYEPLIPLQVFDFERAIHDALAIFYFPGTWEWNRLIVLPQVIKAFHNSMETQRTLYSKKIELTNDEEREWNKHLELGENMLKRYFQWAPVVDDLSPIRVETDFDVNIPDLLNPDMDLVVSDPKGVEGHFIPVRFRGRIDLLIMDEKNRYWIIKHRLVEDEFTDIEHLLLDTQSTVNCWALEQYFIGMKIRGVIYNELSKNLDKPQFLHKERFSDSRKYIKQAGNETFRRTQIPKSRSEIANIRRQIALEALDITDPEIRLYPNPTEENCTACAYRKPCIAMNENVHVNEVLEAHYKKRTDEEFKAGGISSSTFSTNRGAIPPKI